MTTPKATPPDATRMFREAAEAPAAVARLIAANRSDVAALGRELRGSPPRAVMMLGRGSSDHAGVYAKHLIETRLGLITASAAPSVSSVYQAPQDMDGVLLLAISQSGRSPDLVAAAEAARAGGARVVALVNAPDSPLAETADAVLPLMAGAETSVAATKSYIAALAAVAQLVGAWAEDAALTSALDALPDVLTRAWAIDWTPLVAQLTAAQSLYVLGRGPGFGAALEAALKLKETCGLHAEAFSAAEVRHGPLALIEPGFPVLVFAQDDPSRAGVIALAEDLAGRGAQVMLAGADGPGALPYAPAPGPLQPIALIQSFYRLANALSLARGYDPDQPPHLRKVTETV